MSDKQSETSAQGAPSLTRRAMFRKLGLAVGAAYLAPVALSLSEASASGYSRASFSRPSSSDGGRRSGRRW